MLSNKIAAPLKVLQVTAFESPGRRFHGLSSRDSFHRHGIESRHVVAWKDTKDDEVLELKGKWRKTINSMIRRVELRTSLQSVLYQSAKDLMEMAAFQDADLIHLHLIHTDYLSFLDLPELTKRKPTVWTIHDPWAVTGHCIYPMECNRWLSGCGSCPDLHRDFPMQEDRTELMFDIKQRVYAESNFEVIVASKWMLSFIASSPLLRGKSVHDIPFGVDLNFFSPAHTQAARKRFGIADDTVALSFRGFHSIFKGTEYIFDALHKFHSDQKVALLSVNGIDVAEKFSDKFQVVEFGWTDSEEVLRDILAASDIFLMPSVAEAFGMMAVEAMACGKPVICFDGTSLPDVTGAPEIGLSVPRDAESLRRAIERLVANPEERISRGNRSRTLAESIYSDEIMVARLSDLYRAVVAKKPGLAARA